MEEEIEGLKEELKELNAELEEKTKEVEKVKKTSMKAGKALDQMLKEITTKVGLFLLFRWRCFRADFWYVAVE